MFICHKCDRPQCFKIDHLFVGTQRDNMQDALSKGRMIFPYRVDGWVPPRGEKNGQAKLKECEVREIQKTYHSVTRKLDLVHKYNVSYRTLKRIALGQRWGHIK